MGKEDLQHDPEIGSHGISAYNPENDMRAFVRISPL